MQAGDRLPPYRHREEHGVPHVDAGRHVRDARRLSGAVLQRAGLLPGGRASAGHRGAAQGAGDPRAVQRDEQDRVTPRVAGDGQIRAFLDEMPRRIDEYESILDDNPIWRERNQGVGVLSAEDCLRLGVTGPILRSAGVPTDIRKDEPYSGYETYDFDVVTRTEAAS